MMAYRLKRAEHARRVPEAAVVDLPEGAAVKCNLGGVEPDGEKVAALLGKKLEMYTETVRTDQEGNDVVAFKFRPSA